MDYFLAFLLGAAVMFAAMMLYVRLPSRRRPMPGVGVHIIRPKDRG